MDQALPADRGNRVDTKRTNRSYCVLRILLDRLTHIVTSDSLPAGDCLLDYGCGNKPYMSLFQEKFPRYMGADLAGNSDADLIIDSQGKVNASDEIFDCVLSSQVLEHVTDPQTYLNEARRLLRPGGSLIVSTHGIWPYHPDPTDFWRWTGDGLQAEIRKAGFDIMNIQGVMGLDTAALQLWQDSTFERLPSFLRPLYIWLFQSFINLIEQRRKGRFSDDAMVFVVVARKPSVSNELETSPVRCIDEFTKRKSV
jgi:SAM-dependent methyltransferase